MKFNVDRATVAIVLLCAGFIALSFFRGGGGGSCALIPFEKAPAAGPIDLNSWTLTDLAGKVHHASDYADRPYVMTFWATWCVNCRREMPEFNKLHNDLSPLGVSVISVNMDQGAIEPVTRYARAAAIAFPVLKGGRGTASALTASIKAVPTTIVVAPGGTILQRYEGSIDADEIREMLTPYLPSAR